MRLQPASGLEVIHLQSESLSNHVEVLFTEMPERRADSLADNSEHHVEDRGLNAFSLESKRQVLDRAPIVIKSTDTDES